MIHPMNVRRMAAISVLVLVASTANGQSADTSSYFPLEIGNAWSYITVLDPPNQPPDTLDGGTYAVSESFAINDTLYYHAAYPFSIADTLREDEDGRVWARDGGKDVLLFDFTLADGEAYRFSPSRSPNIEYVVTMSRGNTVEVSAGTYGDVATLDFDDPDVVDEGRGYSFARGTGIVQAYGGGGEYVELHSTELFPRLDTLDWHGYMPLAVGNRWQHAFETWDGSFGTVGEWIEEWKIAADSVIEGRSYFELEVRCDTVSALVGFFTHSCDPAELERQFIRYDDSAANLMEYVEESGEEQFFFGYDFRLDAPFYLETDSPAGMADAYEYSPGGQAISIGGERVEVVQKHVSVGGAVPGSFTFAHDIGLVTSGFSEGGGTEHELTYAQVGERTYGTFQTVNTERPAVAEVSLQVYPNPAADDLRVAFSLSRPGEVRVLIYDVLGRRVHEVRPGRRPMGENRLSLDVRNLSSGPYMIVLELNGRAVARRAMVAVR